MKKELEEYLELSNYSHWVEDDNVVMYADECFDLIKKITLGFQEWLLEYQDKSAAIRQLELENEEELLGHYIKNILSVNKKVDLETAKRFKDIAFGNIQRYKLELDAITKAYLKAKEEYHFYDGVVTIMQEQYENKV